MSVISHYLRTLLPTSKVSDATSRRISSRQTSDLLALDMHDKARYFRKNGGENVECRSGVPVRTLLLSSLAGHI